MRLLLEILPAKEAKRRSDCSGKHLGCSRCYLEVGEGLQYGLSGNRAIGRWQHSERNFKGKPPDRQREVVIGEIRPDLSRKIYFTYRPVVANYAKLRFRLKPKTTPATLLLLFQNRLATLDSVLSLDEDSVGLVFEIRRRLWFLMRL